MTEPDHLHRDVEVARDAYLEAEAHLVDVVDGIYVDAKDAAARIFGIAEEYGASEAILGYLGDVHQFGTLNDRASDSVVADTTDQLEQALEAALEARDRLDLATSARERHLRTTTPGRAQHVHLAGREFSIDPEGRMLRSADDPSERYLLVDPDPPAPAKTAPSLTQTLAKDSVVPEAQPSKERDRSRSR